MAGSLTSCIAVWYVNCTAVDNDSSAAARQLSQTFLALANAKTALIHFLHQSNILLCHSRLLHSEPQFLPWHPVIGFLWFHKDTIKLFLTNKAMVASVVLFVGIKPYCCSQIITCSLSLTSSTLSHGFIVWLISFIPPSLLQLRTSPFFLKDQPRHTFPVFLRHLPTVQDHVEHVFFVKNSTTVSPGHFQTNQLPFSSSSSSKSNSYFSRFSVFTCSTLLSLSFS